MVSDRGRFTISLLVSFEVLFSRVPLRFSGVSRKSTVSVTVRDDAEDQSGRSPDPEIPVAQCAQNGYPKISQGARTLVILPHRAEAISPGLQDPEIARSARLQGP